MNFEIGKFYKSPSSPDIIQQCIDMNNERGPTYMFKHKLNNDEDPSQTEHKSIYYTAIPAQKNYLETLIEVNPDGEEINPDEAISIDPSAENVYDDSENMTGGRSRRRRRSRRTNRRRSMKRSKSKRRRRRRTNKRR